MSQRFDLNVHKTNNEGPDQSPCKISGNWVEFRGAEIAGVSIDPFLFEHGAAMARTTFMVW